MRTIVWHPETNRDFDRLPRRAEPEIIAKIIDCLPHVPPQCSPKTLYLPQPWGAVERLAIGSTYRVLYDIYPERNCVDILVVFEKPLHSDAAKALARWFRYTPDLTARRTTR